jgi:DNA-binding CsgD family transcriptional regulator
MPVPIRLRLFGFLLILIAILLLVVIMFLLLTGTLTAGRYEISKYFENETQRLSEEIEIDYGKISISALSMAQNISVSTEQYLKMQGMGTNDLLGNPAVLQGFLDEQFDRLAFSLEKTRSSGAFAIIDATINPDLQNAKYSRAGLYIRNMEPNIVSASAPSMTVLRGSADIARRHGLALNSLWSLEFDLRNIPEYELLRTTVEEAAAGGYAADLARLYLWTPARYLPGSNEQLMLCLVPLIDSDNKFIGACGFEVSSMLFKLNYSPDTSEYQRVSCLICPLDNGRRPLLGGFLSGGDYNAFAGISEQGDLDEPADSGQSVAPGEPGEPEEPGQSGQSAAPGESADSGQSAEPGEPGESAYLSLQKDQKKPHVYKLKINEDINSDNGQSDGEQSDTGQTNTGLLAYKDTYYVGSHQQVRTLPPDTVHQESNFAVVVLMPYGEHSTLLGKNNIRIVFLCLLFVVAGVLAALVISRRFVRPIISGLNQLASNEIDDCTRSNITEINNLISQLREKHANSTGQNLPDNLFEDFLGRVKQLTPTEKQIVSCYQTGKSTSEVLAAMYISPSTLKTHNSHIYAKLNVASRDELNLYFRLLEKCDRLNELTDEIETAER